MNQLLNNDGMMLVLSVLVVMLMLTIGIGIISLTENNHKMVLNDKEYRESYYMAESGLYYSLDFMQQILEDTMSNYINNIQFFNTFEEKTIGKNETIPTSLNDIIHGKQVNISIKRISSGNDYRKYQLLCEGISGKAKSKIKAIIGISPIVNVGLNDEHPVLKNASVVSGQKVSNEIAIDGHVYDQTNTTKYLLYSYINDFKNWDELNRYYDCKNGEIVLENGHYVIYSNSEVLGDHEEPIVFITPQNDYRDVYISENIHTVYGLFCIGGNLMFLGDETTVYGSIVTEAGVHNILPNKQLSNKIVYDRYVIMNAIKHSDFKNFFNYSPDHKYSKFNMFEIISISDYYE